MCDSMIKFKPAVSSDVDACPQEPRPAFLKRKYVIPIEIKKPKKQSHFLMNSLAGSRPASSEKKPTFEYLEQKQLTETPLTNGDTSDGFRVRTPFIITKQAKQQIEAITLNFNKVKAQKQPKQSTPYTNVLFIRKPSVERNPNQPKAILISNLANDDLISPLDPDPHRLYQPPGDSHSDNGSVIIQPILQKPDCPTKCLTRKLSSKSMRIDLSRSFAGREPNGSFLGDSAGLRTAMSSANSRSVISTRSIRASGYLSGKQLRTLGSPKSATTKKVTFSKDLVDFARR